MTRILLLLTMLCFAFSSSAQNESQHAAAVNLTADAAQAVYMGSYTEEFGTWTLILADNDQVVARIDIFANSAKRLAGAYAFDDGTMTGGAVLIDETEATFADGNFTLAYVGKGVNFPVYHIEGVLHDADGNTYRLDSDIEMLAYDYLFYLYYEQGAIPFDGCLVLLQDAPDEDSGVVVEMDFVGGKWEDLIESMGILKITAETADGRYTQLLFDAEDVRSGSYVINDLYASYCYIANLETHTYEAYFKSGTAEISVSYADASSTEQGDAILSLTAHMKAKNGDVYILRIPLVVGEDKDYHDYLGIAAPTLSPVPSPFSTKVLRDGRVIIEKHGHRFSTSGVRVR